MVSPKFLSNICAAVKSCSDAKKDKINPAALLLLS